MADLNLNLRTVCGPLLTAMAVAAATVCLPAVAQQVVQPAIGGAPAPAVAPALPAPKPEAARPARAAAAPAPARSEAPKTVAIDKFEADEEARRKLRASQLERLGRLDLEIEEARKLGELATTRERIAPGFTLPSYVAIYGVSGNMRAVLVSPTGGEMTVGAGDRIARGVTVSRITADGVEIGIAGNKGSVQRIALDAAAKTSAAGAAPTPALMPGQGPATQAAPLPPLMQGNAARAPGGF